MNFIVEFLNVFILAPFIIDIHKVDYFLLVFGVLFWAMIVGLSESAAKQILCIIGYTILLNTIAALFMPWGVKPHFWWAWGWTFAFLPVFSWWKPMMVIFTVMFITILVLYNNGWDKELDYAVPMGFTVPYGCLDWPCTDFSGGTYMNREKRRKEKAAAAKAAKAAPPPVVTPAKPAQQAFELPAVMFSK